MKGTMEYDVYLRTIVEQEQEYEMFARSMFELHVLMPIPPTEGLIVSVNGAEFTIEKVLWNYSKNKTIAYVDKFEYSSEEKIQEVKDKLKSLDFKVVFD